MTGGDFEVTFFACASTHFNGTRSGHVFLMALVMTHVRVEV